MNLAFFSQKIDSMVSLPALKIFAVHFGLRLTPGETYALSEILRSP